jgi:hypothetical protein
MLQRRPQHRPRRVPPQPNSASTSDGLPDVRYAEGNYGRGPKNVVNVINKNDSHLRVKRKIQLNHVPGRDAEPENDTAAYSSCTNCATVAVALQIDLVSCTAGVMIPKNTAIAVNVQCSHCTTVARVIQYVVQVDDPNQVPDDARSLINQMQNQLNDAAHNERRDVRSDGWPDQRCDRAVQYRWPEPLEAARRENR